MCQPVPPCSGLWTPCNCGQSLAPPAGIPEASVHYKWMCLQILRQVTDNTHKWQKTVFLDNIRTCVSLMDMQMLHGHMCSCGKLKRPQYNHEDGPQGWTMDSLKTQWRLTPFGFHCQSSGDPGHSGSQPRSVVSWSEAPSGRTYSYNFSRVKDVHRIVYACVLSHSVVSNSLWPMDYSHQAALSKGFSRQESWKGLPFPFPGNLPDPGIEPGSPALQAYSFCLSHQRSPYMIVPNCK